eukprot:200163-Pyramimonas_sp.AAC.1
MAIDREDVAVRAWMQCSPSTGFHDRAVDVGGCHDVHLRAVSLDVAAGGFALYLSEVVALFHTFSFEGA